MPPGTESDAQMVEQCLDVTRVAHRVQRRRVTSARPRRDRAAGKAPEWLDDLREIAGLQQPCGMIYGRPPVRWRCLRAAWPGRVLAASYNCNVPRSKRRVGTRCRRAGRVNARDPATAAACNSRRRPRTSGSRADRLLERRHGRALNDASGSHRPRLLAHHDPRDGAAGTLPGRHSAAGNQAAHRQRPASAAAKVIMNLDHEAFSGKLPTGQYYMELLLSNYKGSSAALTIVAPFHDKGAYLVIERRCL